MVLSGCMIVPEPTEAERILLNNPPKYLNNEIQELLPSILNWFKTTEHSLFHQGRVLTRKEKQRAYELGVTNPDNIRVVVLNEFPMPINETLLKKAKSYGLGSQFEGARTMGNIILIKPIYKNDSTILSHELVHVSQMDKMGRKKFLKQYILEMEILGYSRSDLESEAYEKQSPIQ